METEQFFKTNDANSITLRLIRHIADMSDEDRRVLLCLLERKTEKVSNKIKRDCTRLLYEKPVTFRVDNKKYTGTITDISQNGVFIATDVKLRVGQVGFLVIPDLANKNEMNMPALIVRTNDEGVGFSFRFPIPFAEVMSFVFNLEGC